MQFQTSFKSEMKDQMLMSLEIIIKMETNFLPGSTTGRKFVSIFILLIC